MKIYAENSVRFANVVQECFKTHKLWDDIERIDLAEGLPKDKDFLCILGPLFLKECNRDQLAKNIASSSGTFLFYNYSDMSHELDRYPQWYTDLPDNCFVTACSDIQHPRIKARRKYHIDCTNRYPPIPKVERNKDFLFFCRIGSRIHRRKLVEALTNRNLLTSNTVHRIWEKQIPNEVIDSEFPQNVDFNWHINWDLYQSCYSEIISETVDRPYAFITEKTAKSIAAELPFFTINHPHLYNKLKEYGFVTFDSVIDESYAKHEDLDTRINMLCDLLQDTNFKDLYNKSREICRHNRDHWNKEFLLDEFDFNEQFQELLHTMGVI